jgi:hypothetical protein
MAFMAFPDVPWRSVAFPWRSVNDYTSFKIYTMGLIVLLLLGLGRGADRGL